MEIHAIVEYNQFDSIQIFIYLLSVLRLSKNLTIQFGTNSWIYFFSGKLLSGIKPAANYIHNMKHTTQQLVTIKSLMVNEFFSFVMTLRQNYEISLHKMF
ncbi:MAG: hypothetical protein DA329_07935 [Candidatus Nitrosocosmicus sp.]|jgi:hypothetical protein|nr:hypothetical protein [Candidatus Nitrosocosmicus sp.]